MISASFWAWPINPLGCHTPLLIASGRGLEGEWLPTLEPPWPESRTSLYMDGALNFDSYSLVGPEIRQSKINSRWVAGPIGQTNRRPSV